MSSEFNEIKRDKFRMWLRPEGIVQLEWNPGASMGLEDALAAVDALIQITGGTAGPLLVDSRLAGPQDRPARMEFVRRADLVTAVAIVVGTPLSRMMGNFFVSVNRPTAPTRLFDDVASASAWLMGYLK
jgi:hypothetical protein